MNTIYITSYKSPVGELLLGSFENQLCLCDWKYRKQREVIDRRVKNFFKADFVEYQTDVIFKAIDQLEEYFIGKRKEFDLPIQFAGSEFQKKVWQKLIKIPYGNTLTYLKLTQKLGDEKAIRAVAGANGANAISIIVPCHRVIGANGNLTGYAGSLYVKKKLLELEQKFTSNKYQLSIEF